MKLQELYNNSVTEMGDVSKIKKGEIAFHGLLGAVRVLSINGSVAEVSQIKGGKHAKVQLSSLSAEEPMYESSEESVDQILEYLTSAYRSLQKYRDQYQDFSVITRIYEGLRLDLKEDNLKEFHRTYEMYLSKYPDAAGELYDAMFEAAGLGPNATIEEFLDKCRPVSEGIKSKIASAAVAGAMAAGAHGVVVLNPARVINAQGGTVANPKVYSQKEEPKSTCRITDIKLEKGLTKDEALKRAPWKPSYGDCRGFHYDSKTGIATWM